MDTSAALLAGLLSGMTVAVQFGAVSALLLETAITVGPRAGAAAGLGVATMDLAYAAVAVLVGGAAKAALAGHEPELRAVAAAALVLIALLGLAAVRRDASPSHPVCAPVGSPSERYGSPSAHYVRFLALTAINPVTIVYFVSIATSLSLSGLSARVAFLIGAGSASAIWHLFLTLAAGHAGRRLTPPLRRVVAITGRLVVLGVAVRLALAI